MRIAGTFRRGLAAVGTVALLGVTSPTVAGATGAANPPGAPAGSVCTNNVTLKSPVTNALVAVESLYPAPFDYELRAVVPKSVPATTFDFCQLPGGAWQVFSPFSNGWVAEQQELTGQNFGLVTAKSPGSGGAWGNFIIGCSPMVAGDIFLRSIENTYFVRVKTLQTGYLHYALSATQPNATATAVAFQDITGQLTTRLKCS